MRSTGFAAAVGSTAALVGFAGAANASATIDLIWADTGTNQISNVYTSSAITLQVILTAGPNGSQGAAVSVDYSAVLVALSMLGFASTPGAPLPLIIVETVDTGSRVESINSFALPLIGLGTGLAAGQSHQLGTVTFHRAPAIDGVFEIRSDANGPKNDVLDIDGNVITATTTFNSAFMINVPYDPYDGDGIGDALDNCSATQNPNQDDTDADDCGNLCDADYNDSGRVGMADFNEFRTAFTMAGDEEKCHVEPVAGCTVGFPDFTIFASLFLGIPGPSGTTGGTTACP